MLEIGRAIQRNGTLENLFDFLSPNFLNVKWTQKDTPPLFTAAWFTTAKRGKPAGVCQ